MRNNMNNTGLIIPKVCCSFCVYFHDVSLSETDKFGNTLCIKCQNDERLATHHYCVGCSQAIPKGHFRFAVSFYAGMSSFEINVCIDCEIYQGSRAFFYQAHNIHTQKSIEALVATSRNTVDQSHHELYNALIRILGVHIPELVIDYMF